MGLTKIENTTNCLASDKCSIQKEKLGINLREIQSGNACTPGGGCC